MKKVIMLLSVVLFPACVFALNAQAPSVQDCPDYEKFQQRIAQENDRDLALQRILFTLADPMAALSDAEAMPLAVCYAQYQMKDGQSLVQFVRENADMFPEYKTQGEKGVEETKFLAFAKRVEDLADLAGEESTVAQAVVADAAFKPVLNAVQEAKESIQNMEFPKEAQDKVHAGAIFQAFLPMMEHYNALRNTQPELAKTAGAFIAQQRFVTKDGQTVQVEGFIQQFLSTVSSEKMMSELMDFKDHLREDKPSEVSYPIREKRRGMFAVPRVIFDGNGKIREMEVHTH